MKVHDEKRMMKSTEELKAMTLNQATKELVRADKYAVGLRSLVKFLEIEKDRKKGGE